MGGFQRTYYSQLGVQQKLYSFCLLILLWLVIIGVGVMVVVVVALKSWPLLKMLTSFWEAFYQHKTIGTDISQKDEKNQSKRDKIGHGMEKCVETKPNQRADYANWENFIYERKKMGKRE
ncbi:hypothetical protein Tco_0730493 [Tanacetum coccineum]|uniref:Uncharacterized protein n=1 Tax=Tanacetum coccineum TaxID=301880 RepID=A0ABQ4YST5_9ASTR